MKTIVVPVDGASNIKLEVLDFDTFETLYSVSAATPVREIEGYKYNDVAAECNWFDDMISGIPSEYKDITVIAPVARGASGGLVGSDNTLLDGPEPGVALSYAQPYPEEVESRFRELCGSPTDFFMETGSILDFPGSLTLVKRLLFEEMVRPEIVDDASWFAHYGVLLAGHFVGSYKGVAADYGNEHSYWMCHTGARNINQEPGTPSSVANSIASFGKLVPDSASVVYIPAGELSRGPARDKLILTDKSSIPVISGGHDTCLSHIPIMTTFYQAMPSFSGQPVIHLEAGSWTMAAQVGGKADLPTDGYKRDILVQGTVDGEPVVTARYGGGNDFRHIAKMAASRGVSFEIPKRDDVFARFADDAQGYILPNINPVNAKTGPYPGVVGKLVNEEKLLNDPVSLYCAANLTTASMTVVQLDAIAKDNTSPVVLTAGGSLDPYYGRLVAALSGKRVFTLTGAQGEPLSETTTLGAAVAGKAAILGIHPYEVDLSHLNASYKEVEPLTGNVCDSVLAYRDKLLDYCNEACNS